MISGGAGVIYKGEGFYVTDYVRSAKSDKAGNTSPKAEKGDTTQGDGPPSESGSEVDSRGAEDKPSKATGNEMGPQGSASAKTISKQTAPSQNSGPSTGAGSEPAGG